jgi:hypothetical protein
MKIRISSTEAARHLGQCLARVKHAGESRGPGIEESVGLALDTSALIELERSLQSDEVLEFPWDEVFVVPAVVWAEALIGVRPADSPTRAARRRAPARAASTLEPKAALKRRFGVVVGCRVFLAWRGGIDKVSAGGGQAATRFPPEADRLRQG